MPIKFRCPHCRQFLGISRAQAGAITDCPTCGRTIRVPSLAGDVAPLPSPELNLADAGLASALDKLAGLAVEDEPQPAAAPQPLTEEDEAPDLSNPQPLPEPIAIDPAPVPVARAVPAAPGTTPSDMEDSPPRHSAREPEEVLADLHREGRSRSGSQRERTTAGFGGASVVLAMLIGAGLFVAGFLIGRASNSNGRVSAQIDAAENGRQQARRGEAQLAPTSAEPALTGRITYVSTEGESHPDAGARILTLPEERRGSSTLPVEGFRAGADALDRTMAIAAVRALGGDFAVADDDGRYAIELPKAGTYRVLIVSRYQARDFAGAPDLSGVLDEYFDRPAQLVGEAAFHLSTFKYRGSGSSPRDHAFDRP
jgi:hypothetical protein